MSTICQQNIKHGSSGYGRIKRESLIDSFKKFLLEILDDPSFIKSNVIAQVGGCYECDLFHSTKYRKQRYFLLRKPIKRRLVKANSNSLLTFNFPTFFAKGAPI